VIERVFNDRYRLDGPVGRGGMATVFAGTDTLLRRRVAIKVLRPEFAIDAGFVERFYAEAQHAARLTHPNIVNVYDVGSQGDEYFIVMEYIDGTTLAEMIETDGRLPEPVAIDYATQICNGLAYAHRQELLHRDIKPANVLVTKDDVVKISDFGIARAASKSALMLTAPGMVMGSVYYVSPEQAQGHELTPASDLYSLGVVIYQMLTGELPYTGETPVTVALKHVSHPVPPIDPDSAAISPALAAIVRKLLQKDPARRFRSATELSTALREARERPLDAPAPEPLPADASIAIEDPEVPPPRRPRRSKVDDDTRVLPPVPVLNRGFVAALVAIALVLAVFAGYAMVRQSTAKTPMQNVQGAVFEDVRPQLESENLVIRTSRDTSETVPEGRIISQDPAPATLVAPGGTIYLVISSGMPSAGIGDLRRFSRDDAERYLRDLKLVPKVKEVYDKAPRGTVLSQSPAAGSRVALHGSVNLTVSKGLRPVPVPDLVSMPIDRASAVVRDANLSIDVTERTASGSIAPNIVLSQDPKAGSQVDAGTRVSVVVSSNQVSAKVPNVIAQSIGDASRALSGLGLSPTIVYVVQPNTRSGLVIDQTPKGGDAVARGTGVSLTVAVSGSVPDISGMTLDQSKRALLDAGYRIGNVAYTQKGAEGTSAYSEPAAGSALRPGEAVTIYYNSPGSP
jgi:serine/threonine-protein kinase